MRPLPFASALAFGLALSTAAPSTPSAREQIEVTCGVQGGENGIQHYGLSADLDCTGAAPSALQLVKGDRLYLNGHTVTGLVIFAGGNVQVIGPGTISGNDYDGIRHTTGLLTVRDVTITGHTGHGIDSLAGKVKLQGATITGNGIDGVAAYRSVLARASSVTGNGRFGISTRPDGMVEGGAPCTETEKASVKLYDTAVAGNGTDAGCGTTQACADLAVCTRLPKLKASTCDTSHRLESGIPGESLGVCASD